MDQATPKKPPMICHFKVDGKDEELFMSFALLNRLTFLVGDITNIPLIHLNPEMRDVMLEELLAVRTKTGKVTEMRKIEDLDISQEDVEGLIDFAAEHVLDFSIRVMEKATTLQNKNAERLTTLKSSQAGQAS